MSDNSKNATNVPDGRSPRFRFSALLAALVALLAAAPFLHMARDRIGGGAASAVITVMFLLIMIAAVRSVSPTRRNLKWAVALAVPTAVLEALQVLFHSDGVLLVSHCFEVLFLGFVAILIVLHLFQARRASPDLICASVCVYLLLVTAWAISYSAVELVHPNSFNVPYATSGIEPTLRFGAESTFVAYYYSMITMTTLGYGDIIPLSPVARSLAAIQAAVGQLYLAILVARLVGMQIAQGRDDGTTG